MRGHLTQNFSEFGPTSKSIARSTFDTISESSCFLLTSDYYLYASFFQNWSVSTSRPMYKPVEKRV